MSTIVVRFPDGTKEFRSPSRMLEEGDVIWHDGQRYRIVSVSAGIDGEQATAIVEPESTSLSDLIQSEEGGLRLVPVDA